MQSTCGPSSLGQQRCWILPDDYVCFFPMLLAFLLPSSSAIGVQRGDLFAILSILCSITKKRIQQFLCILFRKDISYAMEYKNNAKSN